MIDQRLGAHPKMNDSLIRFLAWFVVLANVAVTAFYPSLWGKPRDPAKYGASTWASHVIEMVILFPLCGRILGWW